MRIGRLLLEAGLVRGEDLDEALAAQRHPGQRIGDVLVERGLVSPQRLAQLLSHQLACPWVSLTNVVVSESVLALVPAEVAVKYTVFPVYVRARPTRTLFVAMDDPTDDDALAEVERAARVPVRPMVAAGCDIRVALSIYYGAPRPPHATPPAPAPAPPPVTPPAPPAAKPAALPPSPRPPRATPVVAAAEELEEAEVISGAAALPPPQPRATALVVNAPATFVESCREATLVVGADLEETTLVEASRAAASHKPFAVLVTDDVYAFDRQRLNTLAIESDAFLVVWEPDVEARHLVPLLAGALQRRRAATARSGGSGG